MKDVGKTPPERGQFICIEGADGTGKTTIAAALADALRQAGQQVVSLGSPGGSPLGLQIRTFFKENVAQIPVEHQIALMLVAMKDSYTKIIEPALQQGTYVICDRFIDSLFAYQWAGMCHHDLKVKRQIEDMVLLYGLDITSDIKIVLHCPIEVSHQRLERRQQRDALDQAEFAFKQRICDYYLNVLKESPTGTTLFFHTLDSLDHVTQDVIKTTMALLAL